MADTNSKKPMALLLLVVVAVLVVILMTPPVNCTLATCKDDSTLTTKADCENAGKTWEETETHVNKSEDCKGTYWDLKTESGCIAAGKTWTPGEAGDASANPPVEPKDPECK